MLDTWLPRGQRCRSLGISRSTFALLVHSWGHTLKFGPLWPSSTPKFLGLNSQQSSFFNQSRVPGPLRPVQTISSWRPALAPAPQPFSRHHSPSGSLLNHSPSSSLQELDCLPRPNFSPYHLNQQHSYPISSAPSYIPTTAPLSQSLEPFGQESDLWTQSNLSFADTDWNFVSAHDSVPYPDIDVAINDLDYSITSTFTSISDSATNDPQSFAPSPRVPGSVNSQGEILSPKDIQGCHYLLDLIPNTIRRRAISSFSGISDSRLRIRLSS